MVPWGVGTMAGGEFLQECSRKTKKCLETQDDRPMVILGLHQASQSPVAGGEVGGGAPVSRLQRG